MLWKGIVGAGTSEHRQIVVLKAGNNVNKIVVLGSSQGQYSKDVVTVLSIDGVAVESDNISLPQRNGILIPSDGDVWWQSPEGEILSGALTYKFCD